MKDKNEIKDLKDSFNNIPIPAELDFTIEKAIHAGRKKKRWNNYYKVASSAAVLSFAILGMSSFLKNYNALNNSIISEKFNGSLDSNLPKVENIDNLKLLLSQINIGAELGIGLSNGAIETKSAAITDTAKFGTTSYSTTNVQVAGVDEGDTLKTDGQYIYKIKNKTANNDTQGVQIIKALPAENMSIIKTVDTEDLMPTQLYVKDNNLVVIGNISKPVRAQSSTEKKAVNNIVTDMMYPYNSTTGINIYDISDKSNTKLLRKIELDGSYASSRLIGSNLYFISSKYIDKTLLEDSSKQKETLPYFKDSVEGSVTTTLDLKDITYCPDALDSNFIIISSINLAKLDEKLNITSTLGSGRNIYCSLDNLYIAGYNYNSTADYQTTIYKFTLKDGTVNFHSSGKVKGNILNQFSMDENDGNLRVTTTKNTFNENTDNQDNNLFILNSDMKVIGSLEGLAKGERIYSTRFIGDKAFMVTFKNTDPLFVLDLKNPESPKVLGELKIPGFSTYLHPYDENHIIGIGMDTDIKMNGNTEVAYTKGMKLAIFDVTDLSNPKQEFMTTIGEQGTYSEVLNNHKALLFSKEKNLLAFPISITEKISDTMYKSAFMGAVVYNIDLNTGFTLKGKLTHMPTTNSSPSDYNFHSPISRVIYINDNIYTISNTTIKANAISDLTENGSIRVK